MDHVKGLKCVLCEGEYSVEQTLYTCPKCGVEGILDVIYDYDLIGQRLTKDKLAENPNRSMWRYVELLPIADRGLIPSLQVGWTPLYHARRLGQQLGLENLYIKDDGRNPTASFKDRPSAVAVVKAQELGFGTITCASSGNAAAALAGFCANANLGSVIFVPESAAEPAVAQLLMFGAEVIQVKGSYDQAFDLCLEAASEYGWYNRNTGYNPYLSEGKKTGSLEICEQLGWDPPDRIFVAVGDGCIIGGLWKGLRDLKALGFIERLPQLIGVQAEGSASLVEAWQKGTEKVEPVVPDTIASSIAVGLPRDRIKALRAVWESKGLFVAVSDEEILQAMRLLGAGAAVFAQPAGAAGFAGLVKLRREGKIDSDERVVVVVTGNGLKNVEVAMKAVKQPYLIGPTMDDLRRLMKGSSLERTITERNDRTKS
jgi:threonine synthase